MLSFNFRAASTSLLSAESSSLPDDFGFVADFGTVSDFGGSNDN